MTGFWFFMFGVCAGALLIDVSRWLVAKVMK